MKYIDADKLKNELESIYDNMLKRIKIDKDNSDYWGGKADAYRNVIDTITSLQQEQQEVDLEKEIETSIRLLNGLHTLEDNKSWYKGRYEELREFARHFFELGKNSK